MIEITITDTDTGEQSLLGVSQVGARVIASLTRNAVEKQCDAMHGPIVADVVRFVTGVERVV